MNIAYQQRNNNNVVGEMPEIERVFKLPENPKEVLLFLASELESAGSAALDEGQMHGMSAEGTAGSLRRMGVDVVVREKNGVFYFSKPDSAQE